VSKSDPVTVSSGTTLADKLSWVSGNAETNMTYIIEVNAGESLVPHTLSCNGRNNVMVRVKGMGAAPLISLWASGSMFTVNSGLTLTLENISLQGRSGNEAALLTVASGGVLVMDTGATLTGNANASGNGGGVSNEGKFIMHGGEISGNTSSGNGGGVYTKGTFQMTGGVIYGRGASAELKNTASSGGAALSRDGGTAEYGVFSGGGFYRTGDLSGPDNTIRVANSTVEYDHIAYTVVQSDDGFLVFTFSASVSGLTDSDIIITNGTGSITRGMLSGSGTSWALPITVNTAGTIDVSITKTGIEAGTKTVTVFNPLTNGMWAHGTISAGMPTVTYSFSVTSGTTYYVWWNDSWQGNGTKTLDVMVSAQYSSGNSIFSRVDSGYSTPRWFTATSSGMVHITVEPNDAGRTGTFAVAYRPSSSTRPQ
jgi:hypothetical protein